MLTPAAFDISSSSCARWYFTALLVRLLRRARPVRAFGTVAGHVRTDVSLGARLELLVTFLCC
jgi:hypothetical protein